MCSFVLDPRYPQTLPAAADGQRRLCVALSGGADSTALLHDLAALHRQGGDFCLRAAHVDHDLHPDSSRWAVHCATLCERFGVALQTRRVDASAAPGESPEAAAREARYAALADLLAPGEVLVLAHHADDQAETVLLQLLRGGGPEGLAAMPALSAFAGGWLARPLLGVRRHELQARCRAAGLEWLEDPANRDPRLDRSHLRASVMPLLEARWPGAVAGLVRAASHQAAAAAVLRDVAAGDLGPAGEQDAAAGLPVSVLAELPPARRANALRQWLVSLGARAPSAARLRHMLDDVLAARVDAGPVVRSDGFELRRHGGRLYLRRSLPAVVDACTPWPDPSSPLALAHGRLEAQPATGAGVRDASMRAASLRVRTRRGGERLRPQGDRHTRVLKKLLQARGLPPWQRIGLPLLYAGDELLAVPGVCVAEGHAAAAGERGWVLCWRPNDRTGWPEASP